MIDFNNVSSYYESFDIYNEYDVDRGAKNILNIIIKMCETTKLFLIDFGNFVEKNLKVVKSLSNKITDDLALDILLTLQTKRIDIEKNMV